MLSLADIQKTQLDGLQQRQERIRNMLQVKEQQKSRCAWIRQQTAIHYERAKKEIERHMDRLIRNIKQAGTSLMFDLEEMSKNSSTVYDNHISYLEYTIHVLGIFQFFLHGLTQPGREPVAVLHDRDIQQHLQSYTHEDISSMEQEAIENLQTVPSFNLDVRYNQSHGISIGNLSSKPLVLVPSVPPAIIRQEIFSIPGGHKRWEVEPERPRHLLKCQPQGVLYTPEHCLLVAEYKGEKISLFEDNGQQKVIAIKIEPDRFNPRGIALNKDDKVMYVTDDFSKTVRAFDENGKQVQFKKGKEIFNAPSAIASNGTHIVVSDIMKHMITVLKTNGQLLHSFGKHGNGKREFNVPDFLILDDHDRIVVSDRENHRISIFDLKGEFIQSFGSRGNGPGQLESPSGICQDQFGQYLVVDCGNSRVCRFSQDGVYESAVIQFPMGSIKPFAITISDCGDVAITDRASDKIVAYKLYNLNW